MSSPNLVDHHVAEMTVPRSSPTADPPRNHQLPVSDE